MTLKGHRMLLYIGFYLIIVGVCFVASVVFRESKSAICTQFYAMPRLLSEREIFAITEFMHTGIRLRDMSPTSLQGHLKNTVTFYDPNGSVWTYSPNEK